MDALIRLLPILPVALALLNSGCATTQADEPHVLSGEASTERVIARADGAFASGDFDAAALLYQMAIKQDPVADSWFKLGATEAKRGRSDNAVFAFSQALHLQPDHAGALERLGLYFTAADDADRAKEYLARLLEVHEDNWRAYNALGILADRAGDFTVAREHYMRALQIRPDVPSLWANLGYSLYLLGEYQLAEQYTRHSLELNPDYEPALMNLSLIQVRNDNFDAALATLMPTQGEAAAYTNIGHFAMQLGQYERAEHFLQEGIKRSPTYNKSAHEYLAATRQAMQDKP